MVEIQKVTTFIIALKTWMLEDKYGKNHEKSASLKYCLYKNISRDIYLPNGLEHSILPMMWILFYLIFKFHSVLLWKRKLHKDWKMKSSIKMQRTWKANKSESVRRLTFYKTVINETVVWKVRKSLTCIQIAGFQQKCKNNSMGKWYLS